MSYSSLVQSRPGILHHYRFSEGSGTAIIDQVGYADLTISGATLGQIGQVDGDACYFDGSNDYAGSDAAIDLTSYYALHVEVIASFPAFLNNAGCLVAFGPNNTDMFNSLPNEGNGFFQIELRGETGFTGARYTRPSTNQYHHFGFRYDKTLATNEVDMFLNGSLQEPSQRPANNNNTNAFGDRTLYVGARDSGQQFSECTVQHVAIYSSLSAAHVLDNYNAAFSTPTITSVGGDDSVAADETGVDVVGTNYLLAQGNDGNVWFTNNPTWGSETVGPVAQTVTNWSSTSITITVVQGALTAGTVYAYVEHDGEIVNTSGHAVTLALGSTSWSNISSINGVSQSNISSVMGVSKANIAKVCGVSV